MTELKENLKNKLICIEGCDGAGKTLFINLLTNKLKEYGFDIVNTREPGGTPTGETIRDILKYGQSGDVLSNKSTLLGMFMTRYNLNEKVIEPFMKEGKLVISDRFAGSSYAYQVFNNPELNPLFEELMSAGDFPEQFTIFLDVTHEESCRRMSERGDGMDEIEKRNAGKEKFNNLRSGILKYLELYQKDSHLVIDTTNLTPEMVLEEALKNILA